jgi:uncharacterized metal-binding protein YceD (DUF177 family)
MKIEFRKVPLQESALELSSQTAKLSGTFCKISSKLVKIEANLTGSLDVECCKCGKTFPISLNERVELLVSDGEYQSSQEDELVVVEVDDSFVDFSEILESELESIRSEYYICDECNTKDNEINIEY